MRNLVTKINPSSSPQPPWRVEDIDFSVANKKLSAEDPVMLWLTIAASFTESASDIYTGNLVAYFGDDTEISTWLAAHWEPEELQHGRAFRAYVAAVWPQFDWERAFAAFLVDYSKLCSIEVLGPTPALELASRCVIETGTSTLYRAVRDATKDAVLREITDHIQRDEVRHFKYFFDFFRRYQVAGGASRWAVAKMLLMRVREIRDSDTMCALKHIQSGCVGPLKKTAHNLPGAVMMHRMITARLRPVYPLNTATRMLLAPMALPATLRKMATTAISFAARTMVMWSTRKSKRMAL